MRKKLLQIIGLNVAILFLILTSTVVVAPTTLGILYCCPSPDPVIDGKIDPIEWKEGTPRTEKLHNLDNEADSMNVEIQSVYGNDLYLYFAITYEDEHINPEDYFFIVFKTVEGDPLVLAPYNRSGAFGLDHDLKLLWLGNNVSLDAFTIDTGYDWNDDTSFGGTNDLIGKCLNNKTHVTIEMRTLFNSGDTSGKDINIALGTTTAIMLWFHDEDKHIDFCQILETTNDYQWLDLFIGCTPAPIPIAFVILGLMTTATVSLVIKRRRK